MVSIRDMTFTDNFGGDSFLKSCITILVAVVVWFL